MTLSALSLQELLLLVQFSIGREIQSKRDLETVELVVASVRLNDVAALGTGKEAINLVVRLDTAILQLNQSSVNIKWGKLHGVANFSQQVVHAMPNLESKESVILLEDVSTHDGVFGRFLKLKLMVCCTGHVLRQLNLKSS